MIKLIIFGVLGLLVGLGGGSAAAVMSAKKAFTSFQAERAKAVADSIATAEEHGPRDATVAANPHKPDAAAADSTTAHSEPPTAPAPGPTHAPPLTPDVAPESHAAPGATASPPRTPKPVATTSKALATIESHGSAKAAPTPPHLPALPPKPIEAFVGAAAEKVSKIFGAMPAKDAAKVLEQLDDAEVRSILAGLSDKQAAGILQNLPPQRAAAISKLVLRGGRS